MGFGLERSTPQIINVGHYREAKRLLKLHAVINPGNTRTIESIYESVVKLAQHRADEDASGRFKGLRKKAKLES